MPRMKRRPLISYSKACELYGEEKVIKTRPRFVEDGYCEWCGKKIQGKRRTSCCCAECSKKLNVAIHSLYYANPGSRGGYANHIFRRDGYVCRRCGKFYGEVNEHGIKLATSYGKLEIHHIKRVADGGDDHPDNLMTLCKRCHKEEHSSAEKEINCG